MKKYSAKPILILAALVATISTQAQVTLRIHGTIPANSPTDSLKIFRQGGSPMYADAIFPVKDGRFDFTVTQPKEDMFQIVSAYDETKIGIWEPMEFFVENGEVELLGEDNFDNPRGQQGLKFKFLRRKGALNEKLEAYENDLRQIFESKEDNLRRVFESLPEDELGTEENPSPRVHALMQEGEQIESDRQAYILQKARSRQAGLVELSQLYSFVSSNNQPDSLRAVTFAVFDEFFSKRLDNSPMAIRFRQFAEGFNAIKMGADYPEFSLPDADGKYHSIREYIAGKPALIDIWSSTCPPCRKTSQSYIPVYNEFKNNDFVVVGIAQEFKNLSGFRKALAADKYPWPQLIELDARHGIFRLHGCPASLGSTYLISPEGKILKINPTAEEVREYLKQNL